MDSSNKVSRMWKDVHVMVSWYVLKLLYPDRKVHGPNMGPIWGQQDPGGPHVGPMNLAFWVALQIQHHLGAETDGRGYIIIINIFMLCFVCFDLYVTIIFPNVLSVSRDDNLPALQVNDMPDVCLCPHLNDLHFIQRSFSVLAVHGIIIK